ncbi:hypothetical protein E3N88_12081 [Mikania micrantha]|uniref:Uncharacterized protein n=1 Tax=Mikania micrantha TaxID=192012 RepID=A0A5N6P4T6_9ASTR|nr:hypothetical protein E3N88_12081 [Mikania micrantha]
MKKVKVLENVCMEQAAELEKLNKEPSIVPFPVYLAPLLTNLFRSLTYSVLDEIFAIQILCRFIGYCEGPACMQLLVSKDMGTKAPMSISTKLGYFNNGEIGANAILAVSSAACRVGAVEKEAW